EAEQSRRALNDLDQRQFTEHSALADRLLGSTRRPTELVKRIKQQTEQASAYLDRIESLPPTDAARLVRQQQERVAAERAIEQARREGPARPISPSRPDPERGHGRCL
ncbi:MAG: hypothetical protein ACK5MP_07480, partial [Nostocoides sp.]